MGYLGAWDLAAIVVMSLTTLFCFMIRSNHGKDVDELAEEVAEIGPLQVRLKSLEEIVAHQSRQLAPLIRDKTGAAIAHMVPAPTKPGGAR